MTTDIRTNELETLISVPDAPEIPGFTFRRFRGKEDYPAMLAVIEGSKDADGVERTDSLEDITRNYEHLTNCDPYQDMIFGEIEGKVIGYCRGWWGTEESGTYLYRFFAFLLPEWRNQGLRRTMLRYIEQRMREVAIEHQEGPRFFETWASDSETHWEILLNSEGYEGVRYRFSMARPDLEDIPTLALPEGLEVRPVQPEQYDTIWEAARESFRDEWGFTEDEWSYDQFHAWQEQPTFMPDLWQVAWDGEQVAGMILNFVNEAENREYGRKRGYTETICVRRPWRRQGLARALLARSFRVIKEAGMEEAALGVGTQNPYGALQLYESMGFKQVQRHAVYRKAMS